MDTKPVFGKSYPGAHDSADAITGKFADVAYMQMNEGLPRMYQLFADKGAQKLVESIEGVALVSPTIIGTTYIITVDPRYDPERVMSRVADAIADVTAEVISDDKQ